MRDDDGTIRCASVKAHLTAMFESGPAELSVEPTHLGIVTFNPAFARLMRASYAVELRPGMTPEEMLPPAAAARWRALLASALRDGSSSAELVTPSQVVLLLTSGRLQSDGTTLGVSLLAFEATERNRPRDALAEMQARLAAMIDDTRNLTESVDQQAPQGSDTFIGPSQRLFSLAVAEGMRTLVEDSPVAIGMVHHDQIEYVNAAYGKVFHTRPELLKGLRLIQQWSPECRDEVTHLLEAMHPDGRFEYEGVGMRPDGSVFPFHVAIGALHHASGRSVIFLTDMSARLAMEAQLHQTLDELRTLRDHLQRDNLELRQQITVQQGPRGILGQSRAILQVVEQAKAVASTDSVVLLTGETGTGKELLANAIHELSPRAGRPIVTVNCAALPAGLMESELFGREKGAFTDASSRQRGRFESADGSTLFLDEVAELPFEVQAKLLRVLQDGRFERLGSANTVSVNVRVIAATNHDLGAMVENGRFRADLFYRLRVFPIEMPPLRARGEDIPLLVWDAVRFFSAKLGKTIDSIPWETMHKLQHYAWPGNVRELRNVIERSVILSDDRTLFVAFDPEDTSAVPPVTLVEAQRHHVLATLERTGWRVGGESGAAAQLAVRRSTLNSLMKRLGIARPII